jgi:hypothetical protein
MTTAWIIYTIHFCVLGERRLSLKATITAKIEGKHFATFRRLSRKEKARRGKTGGLLRWSEVI